MTYINLINQIIIHHRLFPIFLTILQFRMNERQKEKGNSTISLCYILFICITRGDSVFHFTLPCPPRAIYHLCLQQVDETNSFDGRSPLHPPIRMYCHNPRIRFSASFFPLSLSLSFFLSFLLSSKRVGCNGCDSCARFKDHISRIVRVLT